MKRKTTYPTAWKEDSRQILPDLRISLNKERLIVRTEYEVEWVRKLSATSVEYSKSLIRGPNLDEMLEVLRLGELQHTTLALMEGGMRLIGALVNRFRDYEYRKSKFWEKNEKNRIASNKRWRIREKKEADIEAKKKKKLRLQLRAQKQLEQEKQKKEKQLKIQEKAKASALKKEQLLAEKAVLKEQKRLEKEKAKILAESVKFEFKRNLDI